MSVVFGYSTRDLAVKTAASLQSHIDECGRNYEASRSALTKLSDELEEKHADNIARFEKFQKQIFIVALIIVAGVVVKGTPLDIVAKLLAGL